MLGKGGSIARDGRISKNILSISLILMLNSPCHRYTQGAALIRFPGAL